MRASKSCIFSTASCGSTNASSSLATTTMVRPEPKTTASGARPAAPAFSSRALRTFCDEPNGWERVMLNKLSEQVRECLEHAEDCARKAAAQPGGSPIQQDFLNLEKNWRSLARSMQLSERLTDFTNETQRNSSEPTIPFLRAQAFEPETIEAMGNALVTTCETLGLSDHDDAMT